MIGYLVMIGGGVLVLKASPGAIETIAFGLAVLVISGIRNAWDLILFFLQKRSADGTGPVA